MTLGLYYNIYIIDIYIMNNVYLNKPINIINKRFPKISHLSAPIGGILSCSYKKVYFKPPILNEPNKGDIIDDSIYSNLLDRSSKYRLHNKTKKNKLSPIKITTLKYINPSNTQQTKKQRKKQRKNKSKKAKRNSIAKGKKNTTTK